MDQKSVEQALSGLPLGPVRFFHQAGSTQDEAASWADAGAPDRALVIADEQMAGRGRVGRRWFTPPGSALALSLILRPESRVQSRSTPWYTALGALALADVLEGEGLAPEIKWPNDVLLQRRKTAGILVEAQWLGSRLEALILGIGVNLSPASVPPPGEALYPATCVEEALGRPVDRLAFLRALGRRVLARRPSLGSQSFLDAWNQRLAFKGKWVRLVGSEIGVDNTAQVVGLDSGGGLVVRSPDGQEHHLVGGEISLRPEDLA